MKEFVYIFERGFGQINGLATTSVSAAWKDYEIGEEWCNDIESRRKEAVENLNNDRKACGMPALSAEEFEPIYWRFKQYRLN